MTHRAALTLVLRCAESYSNGSDNCRTILAAVKIVREAWMPNEFLQRERSEGGGMAQGVDEGRVDSGGDR
jgi:hypothetical protein